MAFRGEMAIRGGRGGAGYRNQGAGGRGGGGGGGRGGGGGGRGGGQPGRGGGAFGGPPMQVHRNAERTIPPPAATVAKLEDALQQASKNTATLIQPALFPLRPGYGTKGTPVTLWANYVELDVSSALLLYRYNITVTPAAVGKKLNQIVRLLLQEPDFAEVQKDLVSDFKTTLVSRQKLPDAEKSIPYRAEGEDTPRTNATQYNVRVQHVGTHAAAEFMEYLTSTNLSACYDDKLPMIQALNIFLNHYSKTAPDLATLGSTKTFSIDKSAATCNLGTGLSAVRGFFASVRAATGRLLVNVNVSHAAFYQAGPLVGLIGHFNPASKKKLQTFLKMLRIKTTHLKEKKNKSGEVIPRVKTILALAAPSDGRGLAHPPRVSDFGAGPKDVEFWLESPAVAGGASTSGQQTGGKGKKTPEKGTQAGTPTPPHGTGGKGKKSQDKGGKPGGAPGSSGAGRYISVYDFFLTTYGRRIANPGFPVVNVGTRENPTYLPPEVCVVIPGQMAKAKPSPAQTQQMIRFAVRRPWENAGSVVDDGLQAVGLSPRTNVLLGRFGLSSSQNLITVSGRVLAEPRVLYRSGAPAAVRFGSWNMAAESKFNRAGTALATWSYVVIKFRSEPGLDLAAVDASVQHLGTMLAKVGVQASAPRNPRYIEMDSPDDRKLEDVIQLAASNNLQLLFIVLPESNTPLYDMIKTCGDVKYGVHTICAVGRKLIAQKGQEQYLCNVALKFNLKLGGNNQMLDNSRLGIINEDATMIVGIDVTHPSPGSSSVAPSVAGMVASIDKHLGQWPAILRIQPEARQEMVADLAMMLKTRLDLWKTKGRHPSLPANILVYRDGVSEGQYEQVLEKEVPLLRKACEGIYPPSDQKKGLPRFTVVVVGKRHHTRFYPTREADADRSANPRPGTVVDRGVTEARSWDFFLQSHAALQGTARPAHYFVVLDEIFRHRRQPQQQQQGGPAPPGQAAPVADTLEEVTQSLCYMFGRATKSVSICTPAYYADIVCERARRYLSRVFDPHDSSATPSVAGSATGSAQRQDQEVEIHARLKDSMFYI